ncbi:HIRAN domain-containing protein [Paractinoplanes atraurantiacus]|uniref:HIRAN domain-containing protein n=1 Tax=Paractinoplanes atraurantiacus TaxID=1036182 RepID=UPI0015CF3190|nr:HIRAN domain-containing protein [Actinoplanes atraurantiacus]
MGLLDAIRRRRSSPPAADTSDTPEPPRRTVAAPPVQRTREDSCYVPADVDATRFIGADGLPTLHLISYRDTGGEKVLRLCEDATGLLVGPSHRRLAHAGIYMSQLRGEAYHEQACKSGDFQPGTLVKLVREPDNAYDPNAVAVYDKTGRHLAAYLNKQKARMVAKLLDTGVDLRAISIRGTGPNQPCTQIAILTAEPRILARLTEPRPNHLPAPARP